MIFVCSDIHGNFEAYMKVIEKLSKKDKLYIIGDAIDRGEDGIKILLDIMQRDNVEFILGNHEWMMLMSVLSDWDENFVNVWTLSNNKGLVTMKNLLKLDDNISDELIKFLLNCKIAEQITENNKVYNLIHGYYDFRISDAIGMNFIDVFNNVDNGYTYQGTVIFDALWNSPLKRDPINDYIADEFYIHGHVPVIRVDKYKLEPFIYRNMIFIDGGLQYGGGLILYNITNESYEIIK